MIFNLQGIWYENVASIVTHNRVETYLDTWKIPDTKIYFAKIPPNTKIFFACLCPNTKIFSTDLHPDTKILSLWNE